MIIDDDDLICEFVEESREHLSDVENQFLAIEGGGDNIDVALVNTVFRAIHSIKGAAGFLGLGAIGALAHSLENVLNQMRNGEIPPTSKTIDTMLRSADTLRGMIEDVNSSDNVDFSGHVTALDAIAAGAQPASNEPPISVEPTPAPPVEDALPVEPIPGESDMSVNEPQNEASDVASSQRTPEEIPTPTCETSEKTVAPTGDVSTGPPSTSESSSPQIDASIRVSVSVLDHLMNLAGELVLGRNQLVQSINSEEKLGIEAVGARIDQVTTEVQEAIMQTRMQPIGNVFGRFPRVVRDLSNKLGKQIGLVMEGKDVEIDKTIVEAIGDPLTHLVRNSVDHGVETPAIRKAAGKPAEGTIQLKAYHQAGQVRIAIIDDGKGIDPEVMKEKAVSKGLLTSDQARAMSDREATRLIFHPGFSTAETVTDVSGRGVGMDVVRTNVEKLGGSIEIETSVGQGTTISVSLPLTLAIIPSLIVRCAEDRFAIPQVNIAELVRIREGEIGTRIGKVKNAEVLRLRGNLLPLVRFNSVMQAGASATEAAFGDPLTSEPTDAKSKPTDSIPDPSKAAGIVSSEVIVHESHQNSALNIIVVETGPLRYGIIVDGLHDSEEIVVKPLGRHLKQCPCLAGATVLGDGHVALILDVAGISSQADLTIPPEDRANVEAGESTKEDSEAQTLLLFTNSPEEQFGVPMGLVARIERVRADQIDTVGGQEVLQYRGTTLPLFSLENHINAVARPDQSWLYVVVFELSGQELGMIVPRLIDIRDAAGAVDHVTFRQPGVIGSMVIDDKMTRLLDLYEFVETARPEWFKNRETFDTDTKKTFQVLLVEDSAFFRRQVSTFLESEGYDVITCEDGVEAWERLTETEHEIQLVVTDIEMPRMDGFQLCSRIKSSQQWGHLPVLALTSLAGEENRQQGRDCGIDDYQVKMDREKLLSGVYRLLSETSNNIDKVASAAPQPVGS